MAFRPRLEVLAEPQRRLWSELRATPADFVLYGGTALALRLGHRNSEDFDFFSSEAFSADDLLRKVSYLRNARVDQFQENTLTCAVDREGPIKASFFGGLDSLNRVDDPDLAGDGELQIASLLDIAAMEVSVVQRRAAYKDYFDINALLDANIGLPEALAAAMTVFGKSFNALVSLKALSYFEDGDLGRLPQSIQRHLSQAAREVDFSRLPILAGKPGLTDRGLGR
ncbi:MAG: nucleotidyl transferase AbiEii/AbiGii toxin family protein [Acidobacteriota bacterium]|nr:nucleotidyl transferase AbiEii/AbiGii toxin family protein [Acidobacteriota bacterium]